MEDVLIHDAINRDDTRHYMLVRMSLPEYPIAMGIIRACKSSVYEDLLYEQMSAIQAKSKVRTMDDLLTSGNTFKLE